MHFMQIQNAEIFVWKNLFSIIYFIFLIIQLYEKANLSLRFAFFVAKIGADHRQPLI